MNDTCHTKSLDRNLQRKNSNQSYITEVVKLNIRTKTTNNSILELRQQTNQY